MKNFLSLPQCGQHSGSPATTTSLGTENKTPAVATDATQNGTAWSVTFSRKLKGAGENHKDIVPGKIYNVGFSIHAGYTQQRFHYVSLERTLVLDEGKADFVAAKQ